MRRMSLVALAGLGLSALVVAAENGGAPTTAPTARTQVLKYHDGKADGKKSYGGSGEMIEFTMPEGFTKLTAVVIHGSRYGTAEAPQEDFTVSVMDEGRGAVLHTQNAPYRLFVRGPERWVTVRFAKPVEVTGTFWIALDFKAHQTKGVYVSFDTSTGGEHSLIGTPETEQKAVDFRGDWMVQAVVGK